ncbi:hypothetical protein GOODEAATRI_020361, partial [Goodea atripinnis]
MYRVLAFKVEKLQPIRFRTCQEQESKNVRHCIEQACTGAQGMAEGPSFWICSCTNKKSRWNHESHELGMCYSWEKR